jgi:hypothetical protein
MVYYVKYEKARKRRVSDGYIYREPWVLRKGML